MCAACRDVIELTLFYRDGCHLCEDMEQQLAELLPPNSFRLRRINIDDSEETRTRYHERVPVLCDGEVELCEHFLDLHAVKTALASYNSGSADIF